MTEKPKKNNAAEARETMDRLYAMTPEEVNRFLGEHFRKMCSQPVPQEDAEMKMVPYKGVKVRKTRAGEIEQVKATIEKIKARRASPSTGER